MFYKEFLPAPPLREFIHMYGILENQNILSNIAQDMTPPFLCKGLVFHYHEDKDMKASNSVFEGSLPSAYFLTQGREKTQAEYRKKFGMLSVIFKPGQFRHFFPFDTTKFIDRFLSLDDYHDKGLTELHEKIMETLLFKDKIELLNNYFLDKLLIVERPPSYVDSLITTMFIKQNWKFKNEAKHLSKSERHLRRLFKREIGLSPKEYHKLVRFSKAMNDLNRGITSKMKLTDVAYSNGYSEQKHFINDFKQYTGLTPNQYRKKVLPIAKSIAWNEEVEHEKSLFI